MVAAHDKGAASATTSSAVDTASGTTLSAVTATLAGTSSAVDTASLATIWFALGAAAGTSSSAAEAASDMSLSNADVALATHAMVFIVMPS